MAGFTDTLRGDGLARAQRALLEFERDPQRLDRERVRFDGSLPVYASDRSGTTTRSQSPNDPSEEQRLQQERRRQLAVERQASEPHKQFAAQVEEERRRIWNNNPRTSWIKINPGDTVFMEEAREMVTKCWVEQGIWSSKWNKFALGRWKHEEPLESESQTESEAEPSKPPLFPNPQQKPKLPKIHRTKQQIAEQRVIQKRQREASRPYYQFIYQISKMREKIQQAENKEGTNVADINTRAYENVKNTWASRGIWDKRWGVLPGMSWKHEEPLEKESPEDSAPDPANSHGKCTDEVGEASAIRIFKPIFPPQPNHHQVASALNSSQQERCADIDSDRSENNNAGRSSFLSTSPPLNSDKQVPRSKTGQVLLPSGRKLSLKDNQPANAFLGPAYPSRVSKAAAKRKKPQRRLKISQKESHNSTLSPSGVDAAEPQPSPSLSHMGLRRSKRIELLTPASDGSKDVVRSKPERKAASNATIKSSAKPHGVSKKQPAKKQSATILQGNAKKR
ncbi:hypothetical protein OCU04_009791 [Sclerotinia nivalis]|uniref:Uncharacterized protein n=1 Tax=Sclerotinia nivalis TaxID=352851 RepID=A0A9X0AFR5_9HELO|nr:hypothetical protein OCU04_009791 [Sclerotinia nivalis]